MSFTCVCLPQVASQTVKQPPAAATASSGTPQPRPVSDPSLDATLKSPLMPLNEEGEEEEEDGEGQCVHCHDILCLKFRVYNARIYIGRIHMTPVIIHVHNTVLEVLCKRVALKDECSSPPPAMAKSVPASSSSLFSEEDEEAVLTNPQLMINCAKVGTL